MMRLSLGTRISLLFAGAAAAVLLTTGIWLARGVEAHFVEVDRHEIEGKLELIRNLLAHTARKQDFDELPRQLDDALVGHHGLSVAIVDAAGRTWFATSGADFPHMLLRPGACSRPDADCIVQGNLQQWTQDGTSYRGTSRTIQAGNGETYTLAVSLEIQHHEIFMRHFHGMLIVAMLIAALATALLGWAVARRSLRPLSRMAGMAATISAERLGTRLPESGLPRELAVLATAFNAMLARLDDSFRRLSEFSSDIAHELRTPVSNLMTQTQVALSGDRGPDVYREILYSNLEELERMAQMIGDMLYLAQTDNGLLKPEMSTIDLDEMTRSLFDFFEAWADERQVSLILEGSAAVQGDRLMLRRALSNLLSNAIRHAPPGKSVNVMLRSDAGGAIVTIENPGPEIPPEHLPRLFDRFYRVDPSRQRGSDGAGLGLAIVKAIVEAHSGAISATSSPEKTTFQIRLPA